MLTEEPQLEECPPAYDSSKAATYVAGSEVEVNEIIYRCNGYPFALYCTIPSFQPESSDGKPWEDAWKEMSACAVATSTPSSWPSYTVSSLNVAERNCKSMTQHKYITLTFTLNYELQPSQSPTDVRDSCMAVVIVCFVS